MLERNREWKLTEEVGRLRRLVRRLLDRQHSKGLLVWNECRVPCDVFQRLCLDIPVS